MSKPKKKPAKKRPNIMERGLAIMRESRASCSLDGETQFCLGCEREADNFKHTCGIRSMTAEERAVVEAVMQYTDTNYPAASWLTVTDACRALRAAKTAEAREAREALRGAR